MYNFVTVLNATEFLPLKWLVLIWDFTSINYFLGKLLSANFRLLFNGRNSCVALSPWSTTVSRNLKPGALCPRPTCSANSDFLRPGRICGNSLSTKSVSIKGGVQRFQNLPKTLLHISFKCLLPSVLIILFYLIVLDFSELWAPHLCAVLGSEARALGLNPASGTC